MFMGRFLLLLSLVIALSFGPNVVLGTEKVHEGGKDANNILKILPDNRDFTWSEHRDILPKDYAQVVEQPAPVYSAPWSNPSHKRVKRSLNGGFIWVSVESPVAITSANVTWYRINQNEFVQKRYLAFNTPSIFVGIDPRKQGIKGMFGWLVLDTYTAEEPGKQDYMHGELLEKHTLVKVLDMKMVDGRKWLKLAEGKWVDGTRVALIVPATRPPGIPAGAKWIDINIYEQVLCAYEGDQMVYATLISSGLPSFDTPTGLFRIWGKVRMKKMSGGKKDKDYYFIEDVPYHMYFSGGIAIHGAYWHDNFGIRQSHGCVNVSPRDAYWLFNWTDPKTKGDLFIKASSGNRGTFVYVH